MTPHPYIYVVMDTSPTKRLRLSSLEMEDDEQPQRYDVFEIDGLKLTMDRSVIIHLLVLHHGANRTQRYIFYRTSVITNILFQHPTSSNPLLFYSYE